MTEIYDQIGKGYSAGRRTDPFIAAQIYEHLGQSGSIVNIGAGTGSYEPLNRDLVAVEPSIEMIKHRPRGAYPVKKSTADDLPFDDKSFDCAMTVLSMHHWKNRNRAFEEIKRVTRARFVAVTWNPKAKPFWLTKTYFPEIYEMDISVFPTVDELANSFKQVELHPLLIPRTCIDGFLAAYWARPSAYLNKEIRNGMSSFFKISRLEEGLQKLSADLESGKWHTDNLDLQGLEAIDVGYVVAVCNI